jgi:hypothetical protein
MKSLLFISTCGLVLTGMAACAPMTPATTRVALDCPTDQGGLKLSSVSPDKKTCLYATRDGDQVSLRLLPVSGNYETALQGVEKELESEVPATTPAASDGAASATSNGKAASATVITTTGSASSAAAKAAKEAADDARGSTSKARTDSGGDKDDADDGDSHRDDHAHIDLPGIHINADDDKADVNVGMVHVNAGENGATVRVSRDVRLRGEAFSPERRGFRSTYILARDDLKDGWGAVGYEAAGPKAGPITVAVFKAHEGRRHDVSQDIKRLVRKNAGV